MFKKKANIPPRPKPPSNAQILEDLQVALKDDCVCYQSVVRSDRNFSSADVKASFAVQENDDPDTRYIQIKKFVKIAQNLEELEGKLHEQNEKLILSDLDLKTLAKDIKKAINALK